MVVSVVVVLILVMSIVVVVVVAVIPAALVVGWSTGILLEQAMLIIIWVVAVEVHLV